MTGVLVRRKEGHVVVAALSNKTTRKTMKRCQSVEHCGEAGVLCSTIGWMCCVVLPRCLVENNRNMGCYASAVWCGLDCWHGNDGYHGCSMEAMGWLVYCGWYKNRRNRGRWGAAFCFELTKQNKSINRKEEQSSKENSRSIVHATRCKKSTKKRDGVAVIRLSTMRRLLKWQRTEGEDETPQLPLGPAVVPW